MLAPLNLSFNLVLEITDNCQTFTSSDELIVIQSLLSLSTTALLLTTTTHRHPDCLYGFTALGALPCSDTIFLPHFINISPYFLVFAHYRVFGQSMSISVILLPFPFVCSVGLIVDLVCLRVVVKSSHQATFIAIMLCN